MRIAEIAGYLAAALVFLTFYMKTMIPLRVVGICSNCAFIAYGFLENLYPVLILHLILLPLNGLRLHEMLTLTRQVREATHGDLNMDWVERFSSTRDVLAGEVVFRRGDPASQLFVVVSGRFRLAETCIEIGRSEVVGEFALLTQERKRTQTLECLEAGTLLQANYIQIEQLLFQNPKFGSYFLKLVTHRLFQNIARLEAELAQCRQARSV
jgi:CRP/FNR family transcriptional regulator, cyclic AMP receptor protein